MENSIRIMTPDAFYEAFLSILQVHGFATVPTKYAIKIIPDATAKQSAAPFTSASRNPGDQLITRVLEIEVHRIAGLEGQLNITSATTAFP